jgi:hypothetical protein
LGMEGSTDGVDIRWLGVVEDGCWNAADEVQIDGAIWAGA